MANFIKGQLDSIEFLDSNDKGYASYSMTIGGDRYEVSLATSESTAKNTYSKPNVGDRVICWVNERNGKTQYNYGGLDKPFKGGGGNSSSPSKVGGNSSNSSLGDSNSGMSSSGDYWVDKFKYETDLRDPQIAKQTYLRIAADIYCAGIASGMSSGDIDTFIDSCRVKGLELYKIANPSSIG